MSVSIYESSTTNQENSKYFIKSSTSSEKISVHFVSDLWGSMDTSQLSNYIYSIYSSLYLNYEKYLKKKVKKRKVSDEKMRELEKLLAPIHKVMKGKLKDWDEESHSTDKLLFSLVEEEE
ncbi:MAG: hypothetical protein ACTSSJ_07670 [Candidatus Odinarchaeia archaeon]